MKNRLIYLLAAAALLAGCFKDVSYKTGYILNPQMQASSGAALAQLTQFRAYAFAVDTAKWTVASYDDAVAGIITSKENPAEKITEPIATSEPYEQADLPGRFKLNISKPSQMVLAIDLQNQLYAYTQQELGFNLPNLYVSLIFKPWKENNSYKEGKWSFYNQFYVPPTYVNFYVEPSAQQAEDGESAPIASLEAYAFAADAAEWYVASYEDALKGTITSREDPLLTRTKPEFPATAETATGLYRMRVSEPTLLVVVVDKTHSLYAYRGQEVVLEAEPVTVPVVFRIWKQQYLYIEDGWSVVNDALNPDQPEEPENPVTPARETIR